MNMRQRPSPAMAPGDFGGPPTAIVRLRQVRDELKLLFIERDELVDAAILALLARQHLLIVGPPGTAKSMLARELCQRLRGRYFEWLLTKFTTPEEVFGPVSLPALEQGRYERVTDGKLPCAEVTFLDEIFKANSAILNALLTVLNERRFYQGTRIEDVPLQTLVAASNELPDEDELNALYDRFLLRFQVNYIEHDRGFVELLGRAAVPPEPVACLEMHELAVLQRAAAAVEVPEGVLHSIARIRKRLDDQGVVASDRRYLQALAILKAAAFLEDRKRVALADLRWLEHVLWSEPEERLKVAEALALGHGDVDDQARALLDVAREIDSQARRKWEDHTSQRLAVIEGLNKLEQLRQRLEALQLEAFERGGDIARIEQYYHLVVEMQAQLLRRFE